MIPDTLATLRAQVEEAERSVRISLRCRLGWHAWSPWTELMAFGAGVFQKRQCRCCGRQDWRKAGSIA